MFSKFAALLVICVAASTSLATPVPQGVSGYTPTVSALSASASSGTTSSGGNPVTGLLSGVLSTAGGVITSAVDTVNGVANSAVNTVGSTVGSLAGGSSGSLLNGLPLGLLGGGDNEAVGSIL